jgi:hypothetical protein
MSEPKPSAFAPDAGVSGAHEPAARASSVGSAFRPFHLRFLPDTQRWSLARVLVWIGVAAVGPGMFVLFYPGSPWGNFVQTLPTFVMMIGFLFIGSSLSHREGTEEYCASCGYQRTQGGRPATDAAKCPECGHAWFGWKGTVIGQRTTSWWRAGVAAICGVVWFTLLVGQFQGLNTYRALPTYGLIDAASRGRGFDNQIWDAIAKRTLSPQQERDLVEGLLRRRLDRRLSQGASRWIEARLAPGAMSDDLIARYFDEMASARLILAHGATPTVGEAFDVHVILSDQSNIFGAHTPFIYVRSLTSSRDAAALAIPGANWLYPHQASGEFAKAPASRIAGPAGSTRPPTMTIRPIEPGVITVSAEVYLVIAGGPGAPTLMLDLGGIPMQPLGTPLFRRFDLTLEVSVPPPANAPEATTSPTSPNSPSPPTTGSGAK